MPSPIDVRQTEALESIAESLNYFMRKDSGAPAALEPNFKNKSTGELVRAEHVENSTDWNVTRENAQTKRRMTQRHDDKSFRLNHVSLEPEPELQAFPYRHKKTQEVVSGKFAPDGSGDVLVSHADGRAEERLKPPVFHAAYDAMELPPEPPHPADPALVAGAQRTLDQQGE